MNIHCRPYRPTLFAIIRVLGYPIQGSTLDYLNTVLSYNLVMALISMTEISCLYHISLKHCRMMMQNDAK